MIRLETREAGFALLSALLGIALLTGIIYLIMHTMAKYNSEQNAQAIGEELAPIISSVAIRDIADISLSTSYPLVSPSGASICGNSSSPLLSNVAAGYLQSLTSSGFDLASSACVVITTG